MPNCGANTGVAERSFRVNVVPSDVTPSPAALAPLARNAAQPSVVPATTATSSGRPSWRGDLRQERAHPLTRWHHLRKAPDIEIVCAESSRAMPAHRIIAGLQRVVFIRHIEAAAEPAHEPVGLVQDARRAFVHHHRPRQRRGAAQRCRLRRRHGGNRLHRRGLGHVIVHGGKGKRIAAVIDRQDGARGSVDGQRQHPHILEGERGKGLHQRGPPDRRVLQGAAEGQSWGPPSSPATWPAASHPGCAPRCARPMCRRQCREPLPAPWACPFLARGYLSASNCAAVASSVNRRLA
jgi:hypothetical protein